jgi:hypothetical protein
MLDEKSKFFFVIFFPISNVILPTMQTFSFLSDIPSMDALVHYLCNSLFLKIVHHDKSSSLNLIFTMKNGHFRLYDFLIIFLSPNVLTTLINCATNHQKLQIAQK